MTTRSADATIKGYYYQFDTSILKILDLNADADSITIEGIEDIDLETATETTAIQCKYLSKPRFINSAVREPIILMLDHFVNPSTPNDYNYVLYAHFKEESFGNEPKIDVEKLKNILTYKKDKVSKCYHTNHGITDAQLSRFLDQFKIVFGKEFNIQQNEVIKKLKIKFNCSDYEADTLYYNNALRIVIDKAIEGNVSKRVLTKSEFISRIDCSKKLFNEWFKRLRSKKEYLNIIAKELKNTRALQSNRHKFIVIGKEALTADNTELPIQTLIQNLIEKYYKPNSALRDAKPISIALDCDSETMIGIKRNLVICEIPFNDGYEEIIFSSHFFNKIPIINRTHNGQKISKTSYLVKLISKTRLLENISNINKPSVLINFSQRDFPSTFTTGQYFDIKYCENLKDINKLLAS